MMDYTNKAIQFAVFILPTIRTGVALSMWLGTWGPFAIAFCSCAVATDERLHSQED